MEHITNLPDAIIKSRELLNDGGLFVSAIPCEGGFLWGAAWRLTTGLSYKLRTGMSYKNIMNHEHVNDHDEILSVIKAYFKNVRVVYNFFPCKHLSLYACLTAEK